jgi:recombination protein RecA
MTNEKEEKNPDIIAINELLTEITKKYGQDSCFIASYGIDKKFIEQIEIIPTPYSALNSALGIGGLPRGRIIEMFGNEGCGKSTAALQIIAEHQKTVKDVANAGVCSLIDAEHGFDIKWATKLGIDLKKMMISQPGCAEEALDMVEMQVRSGKIDIIVIDSVASLVPRAEVEGEMGAMNVGLQARLISQAMRKLCSAISQSNCIVIFINQIREKVGVFFGNPETTPGGRALKFYSSIRLEMKYTGKKEITVNGIPTIIYHKINIKTVKNRLAPPYRTAKCLFIYDKGIVDDNSKDEEAKSDKKETKKRGRPKTIK